MPAAYADVHTGVLSSAEIVTSQSELAARLQVKRGDPVLTQTAVTEAVQAVQTAAVCRYAYVKLPLQWEESRCVFDFGAAESQALARNLQGCGAAYLLCITTGLAVDRLLRSAQLSSAQKGFFYDAAASAFAEAACDALAELLISAETQAGYVCRPRFSPGYADLSLSFQPKLLSRLNAGDTLGIYCSPPSYLMTPSKTITALMGIGT